ncbi:MAG: DUF11 domain-containing protein, partial [Sphingomonadales bacterium]
MRTAFAITRTVLLCSLLGGLALPAGAQDIRNIASVSFEDNGAAVTVASNAAVLGRAQYHVFRTSGFMFNVRTGEPVNGVEVQLLDAVGAVIETAMSGPSQEKRSAALKVAVADPPGPGEYRFGPTLQGVHRLNFIPPPGWRIALNATQASISGFVNPEGQPIVLGPGSFGRQFDIVYSGDVAIDVPLEPDLPRLRVSMTASVSEVSEGDTVGYSVTIANDAAGGPAQGVMMRVNLPRGFRLVNDSVVSGDPRLSGDGESMEIALDDIPAGGTATITYRLRVTANARSGAADSVVNVSAAGMAVPATATNSIKVRSAFADQRVTIMGRVEAGVCGGERVGLAAVRVVLENGAWVLTDRAGLYHFEGVRPGIHVAQIDVASLPKGSTPLLCRDDVRTSGSAISQFVDAAGGAIVQVDFVVSAPDAVPEPQVADKPLDVDVFADLLPGADWVLPMENANPAAPALHVALKHPPGAKVALKVNGEAVPATTFEGTTPTKEGWVELSQWRGVVLKEGDNTLDAVVMEKSGGMTVLSRKVHYANTPTRAVLVNEKSKLTADGTTRAVIAVRILDAAGKPV